MVFSKRILDHVHHLKQIFECCRKHGISLNAKKIVFTVFKGNLLGNIITKIGIIVDPKNVKVIV